MSFGTVFGNRIDGFPEQDFIYGKSLSGVVGPENVRNHIVVSYETAQNVGGYAIPTATWTPVPLNFLTTDGTTDLDFANLTIKSETNGRFYMYPGTYWIQGYTTVGCTTNAAVGTSVMRLYNLSASKTEASGVGRSLGVDTSDNNSQNSSLYICDFVSLYRPVILAFQVYISGTGAPAHTPTNIASTSEVYTSIHIYRMGSSGGTRIV